MAAQFVTIGHFNQPLDEFLEILRTAQVGMLIDIRTLPRSRTNLVYNIDWLPDDPTHLQINHRHRPPWATQVARRR